MNDLFRPWLDRFVVVYLDDILVFRKTLQEHEGHLRQVLAKLREANFKINAKKCEWAKTQVLYLGHVLDGDGIKPEDNKIAVIRDWPTPCTMTELRPFLGLANYYRKFVRNFSTIGAPLRRLPKKEAIWKWDKDCTSALKKLKRALIEYPVLKVADLSLPFVVTTDASQYDIGVVLQQDDDNGYRPVEFMSARTPLEKVATSTYERELYALRQALDHWKHYLLGRHFKRNMDVHQQPEELTLGKQREVGSAGDSAFVQQKQPPVEETLRQKVQEVTLQVADTSPDLREQSLRLRSDEDNRKAKPLSEETRLMQLVHTNLGTSDVSQLHFPLVDAQQKQLPEASHIMQPELVLRPEQHQQEDPLAQEVECVSPKGNMQSGPAQLCEQLQSTTNPLNEQSSPLSASHAASPDAPDVRPQTPQHDIVLHQNIQAVDASPHHVQCAPEHHQGLTLLQKNIPLVQSDVTSLEDKEAQLPAQEMVHLGAAQLLQISELCQQKGRNDQQQQQTGGPLQQQQVQLLQRQLAEILQLLREQQQQGHRRRKRSSTQRRARRRQDDGIASGRAADGEVSPCHPLSSDSGSGSEMHSAPICLAKNNVTGRVLRSALNKEGTASSGVLLQRCHSQCHQNEARDLTNKDRSKCAKLGKRRKTAVAGERTADRLETLLNSCSDMDGQPSCRSPSSSWYGEHTAGKRLTDSQKELSRLEDAPEDGGLAVGRRYDNVNLVRKAVADAAVAGHFELKLVKSSLQRYTVVCREEGCEWRLHASAVHGGPEFEIRSIRNHTCDGINHFANRQATSSWVADRIVDKLRDSPHYTPRDIIDDLQRAIGVTISYHRAWRGKEVAMTRIAGSEDDGYKHLRRYCAQVVNMNPGSCAFVDVEGETNQFHRLFVAFGPCLAGFRHCLPLIGVDATQVTSKHPGVLLTASGFDARGEVFPIAFAVVDIENDDNWLWFLQSLKAALDGHGLAGRSITFLSNRQNGIADGVTAVFGEMPHAYCMCHLAETLRQHFKHPQIAKCLWKAAHAMTRSRFEDAIKEMQDVDSPAAAWLLKTADPVYWSTALFPGKRYGHLTSNISESLNSWLIEAKELAPLYMMEALHQQISKSFAERSVAASAMEGELVAEADACVQRAICEAHYCKALPASSDEFEIISENSSYVVHISAKTCTCRGWQCTGTPCAHAACALMYLQERVEMHCERYFSVETYCNTYASSLQTIQVIDCRDENATVEASSADSNPAPSEQDVLPPSTKRPAGRPRKWRTSPEELSAQKRIFKCSRCKGEGHSRRTCRDLTTADNLVEVTSHQMIEPSRDHGTRVDRSPSHL
ncbi:hypothetical protein CBR_g50586 [Chara braunii]|uniref:SWIM-type domain-containing protein n=1 Tax=Chara braunii TaxID=69332 RepID=A0A388M6Y2_CHABU|nr:hypothetical protein CBR_g50586 [Chara braunii]|eukprot:GBG90338.1 hypothetical protein CBR_g50586 [Chara braunii]